MGGEVASEVRQGRIGDKGRTDCSTTALDGGFEAGRYFALLQWLCFLLDKSDQLTIGLPAEFLVLLEHTYNKWLVFFHIVLILIHSIIWCRLRSHSVSTSSTLLAECSTAFISNSVVTPKVYKRTLMASVT